MTTVTPIRADVEPVDPGAIKQSIVKMIRELLDEAERGEVAAVAIVTVEPQDGVTTRWDTGAPVRHHALVSGLSRLIHRMHDAAMGGIE